MPNIFDGILALTDNQLRYRIASIEEANVVNRVSEVGQVMKKGAMNLMSSLKKVWDGKGMKVPDVVRIDERIKKREKELAAESREELNKRLKKNLIIRMGLGVGLMDRLSDDELSVMLIDYACRTFKGEIPEGLSYSEKADEICRLYGERYSDRKNSYSGSDLITRVVWDSVKAYGRSFTPSEDSLPSRLPEEERRKAVTRNTAALDQLSDVYRMQENYANIASDSENYRHTIEDESEELDKLKREANRERKVLSALYAEKANTKIRSDQAYLALQSLSGGSYEGTAFAGSVNGGGSEPRDLAEDYELLKIKLEQLEQMIYYKNDEIESRIKEIEKKVSLINDLKMSLYRNDIKLAKANDELVRTGIFTDKLIGREIGELENRWISYFKRFSFNEGVIGYVAENYTFDELALLERRLVELHNTDDPRALRFEKKNLSDSGLYLEFSDSDNIRTRVYYSRLKGRRDRKRVSIDKIIKYTNR